ncbi:MAG TPA: polymer-forming cytoskeletal protein [Firmicutes bacterium]|nr:polymer-forming cytoskeletal protein [Bacillota bacterium]
MFSRKADLAESRKFITVVGTDTRIEGVISGSGSIRVDGQVKGEINISGDLTIGDKGVVEAKALARNVVIAGEFRGSIQATGKLEIPPSGRLYGDVAVSALIIDDGAVFKGRCDIVRADKAGLKLLPGGTEPEAGDRGRQEEPSPRETSGEGR